MTLTLACTSTFLSIRKRVLFFQLTFISSMIELKRRSTCNFPSYFLKPSFWRKKAWGWSNRFRHFRCLSYFILDLSFLLRDSYSNHKRQKWKESQLNQRRSCQVFFAFTFSSLIDSTPWSSTLSWKYWTCWWKAAKSSFFVLFSWGKVATNGFDRVTNCNWRNQIPNRS